jgi:hypothetical protein
MKGHVRKRGSTWAAVVELPRDEQEKRRQRWLSGFPTKKAAEQAARNALGRIETGVDVESTKLTVRQYLEDVWLPAVRVRPTTSSYYRLAVATWPRWPILRRSSERRSRRGEPSSYGRSSPVFAATVSTRLGWSPP